MRMKLLCFGSMKWKAVRDGTAMRVGDLSDKENNQMVHKRR